MSQIVPLLWLVPLLPLLAAAVIAVMPRRCRRWAAALSIGAMACAVVISLLALVVAIQAGSRGEPIRRVLNFPWLQLGEHWLELGFVLDPLSALMLVMVSFVGLLIFIYSVGYMAQDENFTRFFCFLSLFVGAMLGLVIANSLLLLFICWELWLTCMPRTSSRGLTAK